MSKIKKRLDPNTIKDTIIEKMKELFNNRTVSSADTTQDLLDISLSDNRDLKNSTLRDSLVVDWNEIESLKQIIYSKANKDLKSKLEDMKKQYMSRTSEVIPDGYFTQTGIYDNSRDENIQSMVHITDAGKVDLFFMCTDNKKISYHKDKNDDFEYLEEKQYSNGKNSVVKMSSKGGVCKFNIDSYSNNHSPEQLAEAEHLAEKFENPNNMFKQAESAIPKENLKNYKALRKELAAPELTNSILTFMWSFKSKLS